jgi:YD repeat-containing protein
MFRGVKKPWGIMVWRSRWALLFPVMMGMLLSLHSAWAANYSYGYDALGRLSIVADSTGNTAQYVYDDVGNLLEIRRAQSPVVLTDFSPAAGGAGTVVTLFGAGFATVPGNNTVKFTGAATPATVTSATATRLVVTVPAGVSTGKIAVATAAGSATSSKDFLVLNSSGTPALLAPIISSFIPNIGAPGTAVTITGSRFDILQGATKVEFHPFTKLAPITSITATTIKTNVPAGTTNGRIRVVTPGGMAVSAADFIVGLPGIPPTNIVAQTRIVANQPGKTLTIATPGKLGLAVFDAAEGGYFTVDLPTLTLSTTDINPQLPYEVYAPNGTKILSGVATPLSGRTLHIPAPAQAGTYSLYFRPNANTTATVVAALKTDPVLGVNGTSQTAQFVYPGQSFRYTFDATAGDNLGLGLTNLTSLAGSPALSIAVTARRPDNQVLDSLTCSQGVNCDLDWLKLALSGRHTVQVAALNGATGRAVLTLSKDVIGTPTVGGGEISLALPRSGQNGQLIFTAAAGQYLTLDITGYTTTPSDTPVAYALYQTQATGQSPITGFVTATNRSIHLPKTGQAGTYVLTLDPNAAATATLKAKLINDAISVNAPTLATQVGFPCKSKLTVGGISRTTPFAFPGQSMRYAFNYVPDTNTSLDALLVSVNLDFASNLEFTPPNSSITSMRSCSAGACDVWSKADSGDYIVRLYPSTYIAGTNANIKVNRAYVDNNYSTSCLAIYTNFFGNDEKAIEP